MLEIVLTREDANTEFALLEEWLVDDQQEVKKGQPVCVVETTKASVEVDAPGDGTLVHLYPAGTEVQLGQEIAIVAETADELSRAIERRQRSKPNGEARRSVKATKRAIDLATQHGIELAAIDKKGFITQADVEELATGGSVQGDLLDPILAGASTEGLLLPESLGAPDSLGRLEEAFLDSLRADPEAFRALAPAEKCDAYRKHGALIGHDVRLEAGALLIAPRIVLGNEVGIGANTTIICDEVVAVGELSHFGPNLEVTCRRAHFGANVHAGRSIRIGGGGHRDPWATFVAGDLTFIGDEVFLNPCRPLLIGREVYVTQRSMIVTHNIGHSVLEGFENRFAPVLLEDMSQVGLGAVVYAGCRIGRRAIVGSNSYVVSDIPAGKFAIGVPARVAGDAQRTISRPRQVELVHEMLEDLQELLVLRGHAVTPLEEGGWRGLGLELGRGRAIVVFKEEIETTDELPTAPAGSVGLTLRFAGGETPAGSAILDLLDRKMYGESGIVVDSVREFCRKKGIRFSPGPWRYSDGLI